MISEIFYSECLICGFEISYKKVVCDSCFECFDNVKSFCEKCGYPLDLNVKICKNCLIKKDYEKLIIPFWYDKNMRKLLRYFKFGYGIKGKQIFEKLLEGVSFDVDYDVVVPVPVHFYRRLRRFVNPAHILAKVVSEKTNTLYKPILKRVKNTEYQWKLRRNTRFANIKGVFNVRAEIKDLKILLVDDIMTTGATVGECASVLKSVGAKRVDVFCLCKGYFS